MTDLEFHWSEYIKVGSESPHLVQDALPSLAAKTGKGRGQGRGSGTGAENGRRVARKRLRLRAARLYLPAANHALATRTCKTACVPDAVFAKLQ
jgi:hypothetical protein